MHLTEKQQKTLTVALVSFLLKHLLNYSFGIKRKWHSSATKKKKQKTTSPNTSQKRHPNTKFHQKNKMKSMEVSGTLILWLTLSEVSGLCASAVWKQRWSNTLQKTNRAFIFHKVGLITLIVRGDRAFPLCYVGMQSCRSTCKNHVLKTSKSLLIISSQATQCQCFWCDKASVQCAPVW